MARFYTTVSGGCECEILRVIGKPELVKYAVDNALFNAQQLDVKDQSAVSRNTREGFAAICKACWDGESAFTSNLHACNSNIPAFDNLTSTKLESERLALLVGYVFVSEIN